MNAEGEPQIIAGRHELRWELGRGGMGVVSRACDPQLESAIAIKKVVLPDGISVEEREETHNRTRRGGSHSGAAQSRLDHYYPRCSRFRRASVDRHGTGRGNPWGNYCGRAVLCHPSGSPSSRLPLLDALKTAHAKGVIHCDIKPGNVMLSDEGWVFGIATIYGETAITRTGSLVGSPEYMAPERLERECSDAICDIWSLGVTLYAALKGQLPFKRESVTAVISTVQQAPIPPLQNAGILAPVVLGMLDRDTKRRLGAAQAAQLLASGEAVLT